MRWIARLLLLIALTGLTACTLDANGQEAASPRANRSVEPSSIFDTVAHWIAFGLEIVGIAIIVIGGLVATIGFVRRLIARDPFSSTYHQYRANLGRGILLGLEFLVGADIIGTVAVEPTFSNLGVLGLIVLIRTFLSFSLEVEIDGHWPWRDSDYRSTREQHEEDAL